MSLKDDVVEDLLNDEDLEKIAGELQTGYFIRAPKHGERAWKYRGKKKTLIVLDCGNHWFSIIKEMNKQEDIEDEI